MTKRQHLVGKFMSANNSHNTRFIQTTIAISRSQSITCKKLTAFLIDHFKMQYLPTKHGKKRYLAY